MGQAHPQKQLAVKVLICTKYHMHVSCLFVICIIIKDKDHAKQSHLFHLSYMSVINIHFKIKVGKVEKDMSEANNKL